MWVESRGGASPPLPPRDLNSKARPGTSFPQYPHRLRDIGAWQTLKEAAILPIGLALPKYKARVYHFYKVNA
jgi:hypothetical protein